MPRNQNPKAQNLVAKNVRRTFTPPMSRMLRGNTARVVDFLQNPLA
jgi:hypothetical protein